MEILALILTMLVGIEHLGIMGLEMFASPAKQAEAFGLSEEYISQREARVSFANQGIYNGMLGLSLIISYWIFSGAILIKVWLLLLVFVIVVGFYGGLTAGKKIWALQMLPAVLAAICCILA
mgnify:CR=1 FL=1